MKHPTTQSRHGWGLRRSIWSIVCFLTGFAVLLWLVSEKFLIPAMLVSQDATPAQQHQLAATAHLLLAVILFILCVGFLMIFRVRRFFFPRNPLPRTKTEYRDAWAEAGKRFGQGKS